MVKKVEQGLMLKLAIGMRSNALKTMGFTLIELLIVVLIISIAMSFAVIKFGDFGTSRQAKKSAEVLMRVLSLARTQAIIESNPIGAWIDEKGYVIKRFNYEGSWQPLKAKVFAYHRFPSRINIVITPKIKKINQPNLIFHPSGDMTQTEITFFVQNTPIIKIIGVPNGTFQLKEER